MRTLILFIPVFLMFASCQSQRKGNSAYDSKAMAQGEISFETISLGNFSGLKDYTQRIIESKENWQEMWGAIQQGKSPIPALPDIDFSQYSVIIAGLGQKNTGGYQVNIDKVWLDGDVLHVNLTQTSPGPKCMATFAISQPYCVAVVPRSKYVDIKFDVRNNVRKC